jgi:hypothetical protein
MSANVKAQYERVFLNQNELISLLNDIYEKAWKQCGTKWRTSMRINLSLLDSNGKRRGGALQTGSPGHWAGSNSVPLMSEKEQAAQERARQAQLRRERVAVAKAKIAADFGIQSWVSTDQLIANPFAYKNSVVAVMVQFDRMISESDALFVSPYVQHVLHVSKVPSTMFRGSENVVLAGRVTGKRILKNALGMEVDIPSLEYVGVYNCANNTCQELIE